MSIHIVTGDFGIARIMENTLDMAETCCGTPCYLSPELCQDVPYTSKVDIWVRHLVLLVNVKRAGDQQHYYCNKYIMNQDMVLQSPWRVVSRPN